jgi:deoxyribodipyrimidine photolyase-related protein
LNPEGTSTHRRRPPGGRARVLCACPHSIKPYAASSSYIKRTSDYCRNCRYKPTEKTEAEACPFNYLYWNFLIANEPVLKPNPRMRLVYDTLSKMDAGHRRRIRKDS